MCNLYQQPLRFFPWLRDTGSGLQPSTAIPACPHPGNPCRLPDSHLLPDGARALQVHRMIFQARSPWFKRMIQSGMREFAEGTATIKEMHAPVFRALLHFVYSDTLPEDLEGAPASPATLVACAHLSGYPASPQLL